MNEKGSLWFVKFVYIGGWDKIFFGWKVFCLKNGLEDRDRCDFIYKYCRI